MPQVQKGAKRAKQNKDKTMSDSLTILIAKVQALLLDDGTRFTTATVTAAVRRALKEYNRVAPVHSATTVDVVADQKDYALDEGDFTGLLDVLGVWLNDADGDDDIELKYHAYFEDNRHYIRLAEAQAEGESLLVRFTIPNTINGLDSETESTISTYFDRVIEAGGAYYAICIRSAGRVEPINLNRDVPDNLRQTAVTYKNAFDIGLAEAGKNKPYPARLDPTWDFDPAGY